MVDSMETFRLLLTNQEAIQHDITDLKVGMGRMETKLTQVCGQRSDQHAEHTACRDQIDEELTRLDHIVEGLGDRVDRVIIWLKALALVGSIMVVVLTIINILLSIGVKL